VTLTEAQRAAIKAQAEDPKTVAFFEKEQKEHGTAVALFNLLHLVATNPEQWLGGAKLQR
jgi:hypothetical protein